MDFVQRAKALLRSTAKSGALKIMPLAAAAAMSMGAATFEPSQAFSLCDGDTMQFQSTGTVGGVTGIKIFNSSGGSCSTTGFGSAFLSAGAAGFGSGTFDPALQQLEVTFEFVGSAFLNESPTDYSWNLAVDINSGGAFNDISGVANSGELVSSATTGPLLIDMTGLAGQAFTQWSVILTLSRNEPEGEPFIDLSVQIPQNSIDINGVRPLVEDVPEPGTAMLMVAGGMAFLVRRRMK